MGDATLLQSQDTVKVVAAQSMVAHMLSQLVVLLSRALKRLKNWPHLVCCMIIC